MSRQTEALKLALKAMKSFQEGTGNLYEGEFDEEIKTCEEALAQEKALQALHDENERLGLYKDAYAQSMTTQKRPQNCGTSICSCIECVMEPNYRALWEQMCERCDELDEKLAQQEHLEPVAWMSKDADIVYASIQVDGCFHSDHIPLYTTPPQHTWVGLTDEEISNVIAYTTAGDQPYSHRIARAIEAKLNEKNT